MSEQSHVSGLVALACIGILSPIAAADVLIGVSSGGTSVFRYDSAAKILVASPVASGLGTQIYDVGALSNGDALIASDGAGGKVIRYDGATQSTGAPLMTATGAISRMAEVSGGDALIPISSGEVYRYDAATQAVPGPAVASGLGTFYDNRGLSNGDALIASSASSGNVVRYNGTTKTTGGYLMTFTGTISNIVEVSGGDALIPISGGQIWRYDAATQSVPSMVASGLGTYYDTESLANGDALIATNDSGGALYRYDGVTKTTGGAIMTFAGTINDVIGLPDGDALIFATGSGGSLWRYDSATQSVLGTPVGTFLGSYFDAESVIPEPSGAALLMCGFGALVATRRRT